jgi:UDP-4-amino-4-deoxy-L-arabinose-oxoglutarate aminotransferase
MRDTFLPFCKPSITDKEIDAVTEVLRSGWITTGAGNTAFEKAFSSETGAPHSVALASATAGMHLALSALGIGPGDEVITPSLTWVSTPNLIALSGATPVFVDVDRDTLLVTPETVQAAITEKTAAIIPVHYAGAPVDLDGLRAVAAKAGVPLIEDAAHALGTSYRGRRIGESGTTIFSFHPIKNITTGEGGMLSTDDAELAGRVRRLRFHGLGVDAYDRQTQGRAPQAEVIEPGFKYNLTDIAAALGTAQLERFGELQRRRAAIVESYRDLLAGVSELEPLGHPDYEHGHAWHLFIVRLRPGLAKRTRDEFMAELKTQNIGTGLHFRAAHLQKYYREAWGTGRGTLPETEWNSDRILSLPLFPDMTEEDVDDVVTAIRLILSR